MFRNILKIASRNLIKNKSYAAINIIGLSLGITSAIVIYSIITFELSFDKEHNDVDRIYRVVLNDVTFGKRQFDPGVPYPLRKSFKEDFAEIQHLTIVDNNSDIPVIYVHETGQRFKETEDNMAFVDGDYFQIFNRKFLAGDSENPFPDIRTVVISKSIAEKYFGDYKKAIGKTIGHNKDYDLTITGVIEDVPKNTDLPFDMFISFELGKEHDRAWESWGSTSSSVQFYLKVNENTNVEAFGKKIVNYIQSKNTEEGIDIHELYLQELSQLHHDTRYGNFSRHVTSWSSIYVLAIIGALLILTAAINFVNLNTALAITRAREIGVRKALGSSKTKIIVQLLGETAFITLFATLISLGLSELAIVRLQFLLGIEIPVAHFTTNTAIFILSLFITVTLLAGSYPAYVLSRFKPVKALKGKVLRDQNEKISLRKGLIVVQLFISQVLIIGVIIISKQVNYFLETPLGLDTDTIVQFDIPDPERPSTAVLKKELMRLPGISSVSFSSTGSISDNVWGGNLKYNNGTEVIEDETKVKLIDSKYIETHGLELVAGSNLKDITPNDSTIRYLVNEEFIKAMGLSEPAQSIGQEIQVWGNKAAIAGVVKDFHSESFKEKIKPLAMWSSPNMFFMGSIKLNGANIKEQISAIQVKWEEAYPEFIFEYEFLDDKVASLYQSEQQLIKLFGVFAALAIFIGATGLFGLISFVANSRTKEIGVRKVLGASIKQIVLLLSKDFVLLVLLAFVVSAPIAWYFADKWLEGFEFKIEMDLWFFASALIASALITFVTVSFKSIKAATVNPVESLRDE